MYLRGDLLCLLADTGFQPPCGRAFGVRIAGLGGGEQAFVVLHRELGIDRQQRPIVAAAGHHHREFHRLIRIGAQLAVGFVRAGRKDIVQHGAYLRFAPAAAGFHIGEQPLDIADLRSDRLHVAHRLLHGCELVDDAIEALVHLLFDRGMKLFVYGLLNLGQLGFVAFTQFAQLGFQHPARGFELRADVGPGLALTVRQGQPQLAPHLLRSRIERAAQRGHPIGSLGGDAQQGPARGFRLAAHAGKPLLGQQAQALHLPPATQEQNQRDKGRRGSNGSKQGGRIERHTMTSASRIARLGGLSARCDTGAMGM